MVSDAELLDTLLRAAAAAGCELVRAVDPLQARRHWSEASLVLLDPGHGGHADGTRAPDGTREADRVLQVALEVERQLTGPRVLLTRRTDHDASLPYRVALADALRPDLSVSVHLDAAPETTRSTPGTRVATKTLITSSSRGGGTTSGGLSSHLVRSSEPAGVIEKTFCGPSEPSDSISLSRSRRCNVV